jgi:hypothetical protein
LYPFGRQNLDKVSYKLKIPSFVAHLISNLTHKSQVSQMTSNWDEPNLTLIYD